MSPNCHTCKIPVTDSNYVCIINSEWLGSEIKLLLLHDNQAWSGTFQLIGNEDMKDLLEQLSLSKDTYVEESRKALTTHNGADNFTYTLENDKFTWKKIVRKNMSVKFGSVHLSKVPLFETFEKVLDTTLTSSLTLLIKLQNSDKEREALEKENNILKCKLNEVVEKKNEMELILYSQFLQLLNEKKIKIKELKKKIPAGDNEDLKQDDERDHFDSDTEIDSGEEEKVPVSKLLLHNIEDNRSSLDVEDEPVTLPKRSRQKRPNESTAGPSGENSKVKNSRVAHPKKQTVKGRKGQNKSGKDSCVMGRVPEEKDENLSEKDENLPETSEDVFMFKKISKRTVNATQSLKLNKSKIKYESDDETDLDHIEQLESDTDKTPSQIGQVESINTDMDPEPMGNDLTKRKDVKPKNGGKQKEDNMISDEPKEICKNSEVTNKSCFRGLSSSTLDILNQLV